MSLFSLENKVAIVTGSSKGLGQAIAIGLAKAGADIIGIGISDSNNTKSQIEKLGKKYINITGDLSNLESIKSIAIKAINTFSKVDILVNNAGVTPKGLAEYYTLENLNLAFDLNVKGLFLLTQEIGKHMITRKYGKIINICSIQSLIGGINVSGYVASKHAVAGITKAFANEWGKYNITVNGIAPGFMKTDNTSELRELTDIVKDIDKRIPLQRWGEPSDLEGPVVFLASDSSSYVNGHIMVVDGGYINN